MNATVRQSVHHLQKFNLEAVRIMRGTHYESIYMGYIDALIANLTGFKNMEDLKNAGGRYRPSVNVSDRELGEALTHIADAYDMVMAQIGDDRRAYRF